MHRRRLLKLRSDPGRREDAIAAFKSSGIIEKCRDAIPGFVGGALMKSRQDAAAACVLVEWRDEQAYEDWMNSPARGSDDKRIFEPPTRSHLYEMVHEVRR